MRSLGEYLQNLLEGEVDDLKKEVKSMKKEVKKAKNKADKAEKEAGKAEKKANKSEESIKDEKSFKEYAESKFKEVFGDKLDKDQMNKTIEGILSKHKKEAEDGEWGKLVGVLNKSFGS